MLLVSVLTVEDPRVEDANRAEVVPICDGLTRVILRYGFMETPDVKLGLSLVISQGQLTGVDLSELTYYLGHETIVPSGRVPGMSIWREAMFALFHRNAERSAAYFCVPSRQVVQIGVEIEI